MMTVLNVDIAIENVLAKYLFDFTNFWSFIFRLTAGMIAIRLLFLIGPRVRNDFMTIKFNNKLVGYGVVIALLFLTANLFH